MIMGIRLAKPIASAFVLVAMTLFLAIVAIIFAIWAPAARAVSEPPVKQVVAGHATGFRFAGGAVAAEAPVKEILESHVGWEIDKSTKMLAKGRSKVVQASPPPVKLVMTEHITGGFGFPEGLDGAQGNEVYVADRSNNQAQEFDPTKWVLAFDVGRNDDKTKVENSAPQEERSECTISSEDQCQAGGEGTGPREFSFGKGIAVSKLTEDVYVGDNEHHVQVLGLQGEFALKCVSMIGRKVNEAM